MAKTRFIRGISRVKEAPAWLVHKHLGDVPVCDIRVGCDNCKLHSIWDQDIITQANVCEHCKRVRLKLSPEDMVMVRSMQRIELYASKFVYNLTDKSVYFWAARKLRNPMFRYYFQIPRKPKNIPLKLFLDTSKVSTAVYFKVLRFIIFQIIATNKEELGMLWRNNEDISGLKYLRPSRGFTEIFGDQRYDNVSLPTTTDGDYILRRGQRPQNIMGLSRLPTDLAEMFSGAGIFGDLD